MITSFILLCSVLLSHLYLLNGNSFLSVPPIALVRGSLAPSPSCPFAPLTTSRAFASSVSLGPCRSDFGGWASTRFLRSSPRQFLVNGDSEEEPALALGGKFAMGAAVEEATKKLFSRPEWYLLKIAATILLKKSHKAILKRSFHFSEKQLLLRAKLGCMQS